MKNTITDYLNKSATDYVLFALNNVFAIVMFITQDELRLGIILITIALWLRFFDKRRITVVTPEEKVFMYDMSRISYTVLFILFAVIYFEILSIVYVFPVLLAVDGTIEIIRRRKFGKTKEIVLNRLPSKQIESTIDLPNKL